MCMLIEELIHHPEFQALKCARQQAGGVTACCEDVHHLDS